MPGLAFAKHRQRWRLLAEGFSSHLPVLWQRWAISLAFRRWAEVVPLSFQEDPNAPLTEIDIQLGFGTGRHLGCPWVFDGLGGELAHTSRPGEIHLDDDDTYSIHPSEHGVNLMQVTMHEIGHVLGLSHLTSPDSVMHPLYPISGGTMELGLQDRSAIQELYGQCEGPFNTVFDWVRSAPADQQGEPAIWFNTYFLRGDKYWLYDNSRRRPRPRDPRSLAQGWKGLPRDGVDAYLHVWTPDLDYTYFFKGIQYWCYDRKVHQTLAQDSEGQQYPQCITEGFPGVTGPLDTAVFLQKHQLVYFFKGYQVWAFNVSKGQVQEGFPKLLKDVFPPLLLNEGNLDASYYSYSHRALFLIKGLHYWKVSSGGKSDKPRLLPRGKVAEEWKDLCSVHPSTLSKR